MTDCPDEIENLLSKAPKPRGKRIINRSLLTRKQHDELLATPVQCLLPKKPPKRGKRLRCKIPKLCPPRIDQLAVPLVYKMKSVLECFYSILHPDMVVRIVKLVQAQKSKPKYQLATRKKRQRKRRTNKVKTKEKCLKMWLARRTTITSAVIIHALKKRQKLMPNYRQLLVASALMKRLKLKKMKLSRDTERYLKKICEQLAILIDSECIPYKKLPALRPVEEVESVVSRKHIYWKMLTGIEPEEVYVESPEESVEEEALEEALEEAVEAEEEEGMEGEEGGYEGKAFLKLPDLGEEFEGSLYEAEEIESLLMESEGELLTDVRRDDELAPIDEEGEVTEESDIEGGEYEEDKFDMDVPSVYEMPPEIMTGEEDFREDMDTAGEEAEGIETPGLELEGVEGEGVEEGGEEGVEEGVEEGAEEGVEEGIEEGIEEELEAEEEIIKEEIEEEGMGEEEEEEKVEEKEKIEDLIHPPGTASYLSWKIYSSWMEDFGTNIRIYAKCLRHYMEILAAGTQLQTDRVKIIISNWGEYLKGSYEFETKMSEYFKGKKITRCSRCGDYTLRNIPEDHDVPEELKEAARLTDYWKKLLEDTEKLCDELGAQVIEDTESLVSHETIEFVDGSLQTSDASMYVIEEFTPYRKQ